MSGKNKKTTSYEALFWNLTSPGTLKAEYLKAKDVTEPLYDNILPFKK